MEPKRMGFWEADGPDEVLARRLPMTKDEEHACLRYMSEARTHQSWRGFASCRVPGCGGERGTTLGTRDMITPDGKWVFPEKWEHYVLEHGVRPDEDFVRDALAWDALGTPDPYTLTFTCSACGKAQPVIADPTREVRGLAVMAGWAPGTVPPGDPKEKTWKDAVLCPECRGACAGAAMGFVYDHNAPEE